MTMENEGEHLDRALMASRFVAEDAKELAALIVQSEGIEQARETVAALERTRNRLGSLTAGCELALCFLREALQDA